MNKAVAAIAVMVLAAQLASLPVTLEDLDSINFALGVRDFHVAQHQPHPPGYPAFIALGKLATAACAAIGIGAPEVRGLAVWSAIGTAALVPILYLLFAAFGTSQFTALLGAVLAVTAPVAWFTGVRPLSDMTGLAAAMAAVAAIAGTTVPEADQRARGSTTLLAAGAFLAGLAIGLRVQTAALTLPLLAWTLVSPWPALTARTRVAAIGAAAAGVLAWAVPLVVASGGLDAYLAALGSQAGEDFSGVVMLWTNRTARVAAFAVLHTFVLPWDSPVLAGVMLALAVAGALVLVLRRALRALRLLTVIFGPYAVFHLLFQETVTVRYALPLLVPVAYLTAVVLSEARRSAALAGAAGITVFSLSLAAPATWAFGRTPAPVFQLLSDLRSAAVDDIAVGMHRRVLSESRRARQWSGGVPGRLLPSPRDYEWLEVTRNWRQGFRGATWFLADPRRTDLALVDPRTDSTRPYRWPFDSDVYVGGTRPDEIDWHTWTQPGWFLERGWALTPEVAGITERDGWGPHRRPSEGWIRRRPGAAVMLLGGRHLGAAGEPEARIQVALDARPIAELTTGPGFFVRFIDLQPGALAGGPPGSYAHLTVTASGATGAAPPRIGLEQFDVQDAEAIVFGFGEGWYELEYNPRTARSWRWMSDRAVVDVNNAGHRPLELEVRGEAPRHYFGTPPELTVSAGGRELARFRPFDDFAFQVEVPADLLEADRRIVLASTLTFVPGEREGTADRRRLALKVYSVEVRAAAGQRP